MVECEFCSKDVKTMIELEDHLKESHGFNEEELEEYGFDRGLYYEAEFKKMEISGGETT